MVSLESMLNSGLHLGHSINNWNPKMSKFIFCKRNGIHIIDILQTLICLQKVRLFLNKSNLDEKNFVFNNNI